jgi:hypothetical protein
VSFSRHNQIKNRKSNSYIKGTKLIDKKPKFITKRMTDAERQRLFTFIKQKQYTAQQENNPLLLEKYESLEAVLGQIISNNLKTANINDEKIYTQYFNLIIAELESLGENPQLILHTTDLRQKFLEGHLEKSPWFVKEIGALDWLFEQDAKEEIFNQNQLKYIHSVTTQWPKLQDKALYVISLVEQIERNHQRVETDDLAAIIQTCQEYLISFLPDMSNVFKRTIQEALNKLEKVRNIREIPSLKEDN